MKNIKNMKLGNKFLLTFIFFLITFYTPLFPEDKIISSPLINLDKLKPSFEEVEISESDTNNKEVIKNKKNFFIETKSSTIKLSGLDKITAKTSEINLNLGESKKFGPLEIKILKCGKIEIENNNYSSVAYMQVKDLSENENEKIFIFNGWTFSSDPTIAPFDHAIYDLQLVNCNNV